MPFHIHNLHFTPTPAFFAGGLAVLAVMAFLCVLSWRRSPHPKRTAILESLRFLATLLAVLLLWKPEWHSVILPETKPRIAILWDDSKSMTTLDAPLAATQSTKETVVTRAEWVKHALASPLWNALEENGANELVRGPFATPPTDPAKAAIAGTDIESPLSSLLERETNLRAVVLLTDGDSNTGQPPFAAAQKYRLRGVPIFPIPVGSATRLPDLDLLSVNAPTYGITGENVQIPFTIRSSLDHEVRTIVRIRDENGRERTKPITLPPNAETSEAILWKLEKDGASTLELSIPVAAGETIDSNNSRKFVLSAQPEKIKVLLVESLPRWEYRYLRNALVRDPGVELSCLLFHPQLGKGDGPHYIQEFPAKPEELAKYSVIILGDVGIAPDQLTKEQCTLIRGLVENQASGVVFLPGAQGNQFSLLNSDLSDLMPVVLDDTHITGLTDTTPSPLNLTSEGRNSLLTLLADTEEDNPTVWHRLPGFYWYAPVIKAKGGTEVLAVHGNRRGKFGPIPLLVTKTAGSGKVLFMGIDSAWRWRRGVEDKYHYRFWGQVARWMSYQRNMAAGQRVRMFFTPERPKPGDMVTINANAFDPNGAPLKDGTVSVDMTGPDGNTRRISLEKDNAEWGSYSGHFKIELPGTWKLHATVTGAEDKPVDTTILAQGIELEKVGQPARPDTLEEIARISRGRLIQPQQLPDLVKEIRALPEPRPIEILIPLWSHWLSVTALVALLAIFWTGRKLNGVF